ncbi:MAG: GNAT family N-acetyltransferase [Chloroflexota bacterium]|nr:GNAT family N-acetyltransferase [Chloroflexota bacterium]
MEPYRLSAEHAEAAGDLLAAAFFPAALAAFITPDPTRRARRGPLFYAALTRLVVRHGEATAYGAPLQAVALWLPPDRQEPTEAELAEVGLTAVRALMDEGEAARSAALNRHFDAAHERVMDRPHWYLPFLAVALEQQGRGAGSRLMRHTLDRADVAGVPCYLDSADERNLPFYERLGFRVVGTGMVPGSQVRTWSMRRG